MHPCEWALWLVNKFSDSGGGQLQPCYRLFTGLSEGRVPPRGPLSAVGLQQVRSQWRTLCGGGRARMDRLSHGVHTGGGPAPITGTLVTVGPHNVPGCPVPQDLPHFKQTFGLGAAPLKLNPHSEASSERSEKGVYHTISPHSLDSQ